MRSVFLSVLAAAVLIGIANWHYASASVTVAQAAAPKPTAYNPLPDIAFKPGSGRPGGWSPNQVYKSADAGHIYEKLIPLYYLEVISDLGTSAIGKGGESLRATSKVPHEGVGPTPTPGPPHDLVLYKLSKTKWCWHLESGRYFQPYPLPSPGVPVVIQAKDGTVTVTTSMECYPGVGRTSH